MVLANELRLQPNAFDPLSSGSNCCSGASSSSCCGRSNFPFNVRARIFQLNYWRTLLSIFIEQLFQTLWLSQTTLPKSLATTTTNIQQQTSNNNRQQLMQNSQKNSFEKKLYLFFFILRRTKIFCSLTKKKKRVLKKCWGKLQWKNSQTQNRCGRGQRQRRRQQATNNNFDCQQIKLFSFLLSFFFFCF